MKIKILAVLALLIMPLAALAEVTKLPDGTVMEGAIVDGEPQGQFVITFPDGTVMEGAIVDGERQGHWIIKLADGRVREGPFLNGVKQGQWIESDEEYNDYSDERYPYIAEGLYVNGVKQGQWTHTFKTNSAIAEGPYVNGVKQGRWIMNYSDGDDRVHKEIHYVNGKKHGLMIVNISDGHYLEVPFVNGKRHGLGRSNTSREPWRFRTQKWVNGEWVDSWYENDSDQQSTTQSHNK